jgi:hypothetical protein
MRQALAWKPLVSPAATYSYDALFSMFKHIKGKKEKQTKASRQNGETRTRFLD